MRLAASLLFVLVSLFPTVASATEPLPDVPYCAPPSIGDGCPTAPYTGGDPDWRPEIPADAVPSCGVPAPDHPCYEPRTAQAAQPLQQVGGVPFPHQEGRVWVAVPLRLVRR